MLAHLQIEFYVVEAMSHACLHQVLCVHQCVLMAILIARVQLFVILPAAVCTVCTRTGGCQTAAALSAVASMLVYLSSTWWLLLHVETGKCAWRFVDDDLPQQGQCPDRQAVEAMHCCLGLPN